MIRWLDICHSYAKVTFYQENSFTAAKSMYVLLDGGVKHDYTNLHLYNTLKI